MDQSRIDTFDKTRVTASILNVVLHVLVPFMVFTTGMWPFSFGNTKLLLPDIIVFIIHNSNMNVFFFMSGFFSFFLLNKSQSLKAFAINRFNKIILPFFIAWLLLIPFILLSFPLANDIQNNSIKLGFNECVEQAIYLFTKYKIPTAHLWFMFYWCIYFLFFILLNSLNITKNTLFKLSNLIKPEWFICILILGSFLCRICTPESIILNPLSIIPELHSLLYYFLYFITGCFSYYWLINNVKTKIAPKFLFAFSIFATSITLVCLHLIKQDNYYSWFLKFILVLFSTTSSISNSMCLVLLSKKIKSGLILDMLLNSTYWVYLLHIPVLIFFQLLLLHFNFTIYASFILSLTLPYAACLLFYAIFGHKLMRK